MAGGILLFSIIVVNISPKFDFSSESCSYWADKYEYDNKKDLVKDYGNNKESKDKDLYKDKRSKTRCERGKAMTGLEYAALNINLVFGFICTLLGFIYYFNITDVRKIACFAGLGTGIVGFVLTLVYVIESGLVFNDYDYEGSSNLRMDSDGAVMEYNSKAGRYKCIYYKKGKYDSIYKRYSDYGNKYLNYYKDVRPEEKNYKFQQCTINRLTLSSYPSLTYERCKSFDEDSNLNRPRLEYINDQSQKIGECDKLGLGSTYDNNSNKKVYDHWLTTIIFSCFIFLMDIGLAIFAFLNLSDSQI
jgi:hypothetical protein